MPSLSFAQFTTVLSLCFAASSFFSSPANGQGSLIEQLYTRDVAYPRHGLEVGTGWNSFTDQKTQATCIDFMEAPIPNANFRQEFKLIQDNNSNSRTTEYSTSGSYKYYGIKGEHSGSTYKKSSINRDYLSVLFTAEFNFGSTQALPIPQPRKYLSDSGFARTPDERLALRYGQTIHLTKEARDLFNQGDMTKFMQVCGDSFVIAVHRGTRASVMATLKKTNSSDKRRFAGSIAAKGWGGTFSFTGTGDAATAAFSESIDIKTYQEGGIEPFFKVSAALTPTLFDDLLATGKLLENPSSLTATVVSYASLVDFAGSESHSEDSTLTSAEKNALDKKASETLKHLSMFSKMDDVRTLYYYLQDLEVILSEIDEMKTVGVPADEWVYSPISIRSLEDIRDIGHSRFQVQRLMRIMGSSFDKCYDDIIKCDPSKVRISDPENINIQLQLDAHINNVETKYKLISESLEEAKRTVSLLTQKPDGTDLDDTELLDILMKWQGFSAPSSQSTKDVQLRIFKDDSQFDKAINLSQGKISSPAGDTIDPSGFFPIPLEAIEFGNEITIPPGIIDPANLEGDQWDVIQLQLTKSKALVEKYQNQLADLVQGTQRDIDAISFYYFPLLGTKGTLPAGEEPNPDVIDLSCEKTLSQRSMLPTSILDKYAGQVPSEIDASFNKLIKQLRNLQVCTTVSLGMWVDGIFAIGAATPLTKDQINLDGFQTNNKKWSESADNKYERRRLLTEHMKKAIYAERLYPFREGLCQTTLSEDYCVSNVYLFKVVEDLEFVILDEWLDEPEKIPPPSPVNTGSGCYTERDRNGRERRSVGCL
jgi:hypothetical protein